MRNITVVQLGLGIVGRAVTKALVGKHGLQIVGAIDLADDKVGRDLGQVAGLPEALNVKVESDPDALFGSIDADIVVHAACSHLADAVEQLTPALKHGVDIVSAAEELGYPYASHPGLAARLERLAKDNGATVLGTGLSPGWASDYLILAATAACTDVRSVRYHRVANASVFLGSIVAKHFGLGLSADEFKKSLAAGEITGHIGFIESARVIADCLGWRLDRIERVVKPTHTVDGEFVCTETIVKGYRGDHPVIELIIQSVIDPATETFERITIAANPPVDIQMKPNTPSIPATAHALVNAIPHVINAPPGLITPGDLPLVHAFEGDFRHLLRA
jgi:2,4-diaminopentanoate dehydrogenase